MNDLISRQAAIEVIYRALKTPAPDYRKDPFHDSMGLAIAMADQIPSVQQWTPCIGSERLPVQNGIYVVTRTISDGFEYNNITDCCYFDGTNTWHDDTRVNHGRKYLADVIAWQPLPEPYQET